MDYWRNKKLFGSLTDGDIRRKILRKGKSINEKIHKLVTPKEGSKGYLLNLEENKINEKVLDPDLLNA